LWTLSRRLRPIGVDACRLSFLAGLRLFIRKHPEVGRYITGKVKKAYAGPCRLVGTTDFLRPGFLDFIELYRDHPEGLMPVCVAGQLATYDTSWAPTQKAALPRARFKKVVTRSCREAIRAGVYGMSGSLRLDDLSGSIERESDSPKYAGQHPENLPQSGGRDRCEGRTARASGGPKKGAAS
jgi:hypothetical protein